MTDSPDAQRPPPPADDHLPVQKLKYEFNWKIINRCNYRCAYCFFTLAGSWDHETARDVFLPVESWIAAWSRIYQQYGSVKIGITGGEPTLYPGFDDLAEKLTGWHRLYIDTNLSRDLPWVQGFVKRVRSHRVDFGISFHPDGARFEEFVPKMALIHGMGFDYRLYLVCYPPLLPRLLSFQKLFAREGFNVVVAPFRGQYQGRDYPMAYTAEEEDIIRQMAEAAEQKYQSWVSQQLEPLNPFGRKCHAGQSYLRVENDGSVWRCGQYYADGITLPLRNFLEPDFRLCAQAEPCAASRCGCEWRFLADQGPGRGDMK